MEDWSSWRRFPDPARSEYLHAPFGLGVYELRLGSTGELILVGEGARLAHRMTSLLPAPLGSGTRRNTAKREFVGSHLGDVEYRTLACSTKQQAQAMERVLRGRNRYRFPT